MPANPLALRWEWRRAGGSGKHDPVKGRRSVEDYAAVHVEGLTGDVSRAGRGQKYREGRHVIRLVGPAERNGGVPPARHLFHGEPFLAGAQGHVGFGERGDGDARANGVDVDVVTGELLGGGAREEITLPLLAA